MDPNALVVPNNFVVDDIRPKGPIQPHLKGRVWCRTLSKPHKRGKNALEEIKDLPPSKMRDTLLKVMQAKPPE